MNSFRPMVKVDGEWSGNGLRFATHAEALSNARNLMSRWFLVDDVDVHGSDDVPNYRWENETLVAV